MEESLYGLLDDLLSFAWGWDAADEESCGLFRDPEEELVLEESLADFLPAKALLDECLWDEEEDDIEALLECE